MATRHSPWNLIKMPSDRPILWWPTMLVELTIDLSWWLFVVQSHGCHLKSVNRKFGIDWKVICIEYDEKSLLPGFDWLTGVIRSVFVSRNVIVTCLPPGDLLVDSLKKKKIENKIHISNLIVWSHNTTMTLTHSAQHKWAQNFVHLTIPPRDYQRLVDLYSNRSMHSVNQD